MTPLPALREALAKGMKLLEALAEPHEQPDGEDHAWRTCRRCLALEEGETEHARQLFRALLDEVEALRANADDDTAIVSRARDICHRHGYVVDADTEGWTTCALRSLEAEVAAARKVLETAIELPGYCAYAVIGVDAAAWQAWQARRKP